MSDNIEKAARELISNGTPYAVLTDPCVHVTILYSLFDPTDRTIGKIVYQHGKTLADYVEGLPDHANWAISLNGRVVEPEELVTLKPAPGDFIGIIQIPLGGGGKKSILRLVAMLAVAAFAAWAAPALLSGTALAGSAVAKAVVGGLITSVGSMLVNALLPPPTPKAPGADTIDQSPTYGVDGAKNTHAEDFPLGVVYGQFRVGGNIVGLYNENITYVDPDDEEEKSIDTQNLYMQLALSEGEIEAIEDIELDDQPIANFRDIEIKQRFGTADQSVIGWFDDTITLRNKGQTLSTDWATHKTTQPVDKLRVDIIFPGGLSGVNQDTGKSREHTVDLQFEYRLWGEEAWTGFGGSAEDGVWVEFEESGQTAPDAAGLELDMNFSSATQQTLDYSSYDPRDGGPVPTKSVIEKTVEVEYRQVGTGTWLPLGSKKVVYDVVTETDPRETGYVSYPTGSGVVLKVEGLAPGAYEVRTLAGSVNRATFLSNSGVRITENRRNAVRRSFSTDVLPQGVYEVRVRRTEPDIDDDYIQDTVALSDVGEIIVDDVRYVHTALLALKVRLTDQLTSVPNITSRVKGVKVDHYDVYGNFAETKWSNNPAWVTLDILTHSRRGAGLVISRFDLPRFAEWAEYCDLKGLTFNGVFDYATNIWDAAQKVCRAGHAQVINIGTRFGVAIDKIDTPGMMFSMGNIIKDSFSINWLPKEDRANEVEVTYFDESDKFKEHAVKIYDQQALDRGEPAKPANIHLLGVTKHDLAVKEAWLVLARNRYILQTVSFEAPIEAIACTVGDLVYIQHDMPEWGQGGRLRPGSTATTLLLDKEVELVEGGDHRALVHMDALKRYDVTVQTRTAYSVHVTGLPQEHGRVTRAILNGKDLEIKKAYYGQPYSEIVLDDLSGINVGDQIELWDTDVIEERVVTGTPGTTTELTLQTALSGTPESFANWMFGENLKIKKPFRIMNISGTHEHKREVSAVEYDERVWDDPEMAPPPPNYSSLVTTIGQVEVKEFDEDLFRRGNSIGTKLRVSWNKPSEGAYEGADVWLNRDDGGWQHAAYVAGAATSYQFEVEDGEYLKIQIVAVDAVGHKAPRHEAVIYTYRVIGKMAKPSKVADFKVGKETGGIVMTWSANPEIDVTGYEIREGLSWDDGEIIVSNYSGTRFATQKTQAGTYTYHIAAIDVLGNYSSEIATVVLELPAPSRVRGFNVVQDGLRTNFYWKHDDSNVVAYEIREGVNWGSSLFVAKVGGSSHSISTDVPTERTYWIKAIDSAGVYSDQPVFSTTKIAPIANRNVIVESDERAGGFTGFKINTHVDVGGDLLLDDDEQHGEYLSSIDLGVLTVARNVVERQLGAIVNDSPSWDEATFTWDDPAAAGAWEKAGDLESVDLTVEIARETGNQAGDVEQFALDGGLTGVGGTTAIENTGESYQAGRFANGLYVGDLTNVSWNVAIPAEFSASFWVTPKEAGVSAVHLALVNGAEKLKLGYRMDLQAFFLEDNAGNIVYTDPITPNVDDRILISISQDATTRAIRVGKMGETAFVKGEIAAPPVGAWTALRLYGF